MSPFSEQLQQIVSNDPPVIAQVFGEDLDSKWVEEASLESTQLTIRKRKFPSEVVIWLVIAMAVWRDMAMVDVVRRLDIVRSEKKDGKRTKVAKSSITEARHRLGSKPLETLFFVAASFWLDLLGPHERLFHGRRVFAMDGTTLMVPDTEANRREFGGPSNQHGQSGYPIVRIMVLLAAGSHLVANAAIAGYSGKGTGEQTLAKGMAAGLPDSSILLFDAGLFNCFELWKHQSSGQDRDWLGRIKLNLNYTVVETLGPGDERARFKVPSDVRREHPEMPEWLEVRVLTSQDSKGEVFRLMTTLLDAAEYPAEELWSLYNERWEVELGNREVKTYLLERNAPLRSKTPDGVRQEVWGILLAYNLIRYRMGRAASQVGLEGRQLSFKGALWNISVFCAAMAWMVAPTKIPALLARLDEALIEDVLPAHRKRAPRPRAVKGRKKTYPILRDVQTGDTQGGLCSK
jgi:hypothetical protein